MPTHAAAIRAPRTQAKNSSVRNRPSKPYADFPLFPHRNGQWAKKIRNRFVFFGPWDDAMGALDRYLIQRDELHAGRVPRGRETRPAAGGAALGRGSAPSPAGANDGPTLRDLANRFLTAKKRRLEAGDMGLRSFSEYHKTCERVLKVLGKHRLVDDVSAGDFGVLRASLARKRGPVTVSGEIQRVRSLFKFAYDAGLIDKPVRFGPEFKKPPMRVMRQAKEKAGPRMFEADEVRKLIASASPQLRAMILLGVNCGLGNTDVSCLSRSALDLDAGILEFPRPKTAIPRRATLWPETIEALRVLEPVRPAPRDEADDDLVFITKYGRQWVRVREPKSETSKSQATVVDAVSLEFGKLMRACKVYQSGRGFYALRHTFRTIADEVGDRPAVDLTMGHQDGSDISVHYVERISDERLRRVTEHVREWVFADR